MKDNLLRLVCLILTAVAATSLVNGALRAADEDRPKPHSLAIVQDDSEGVFRFTIDGYEVARLDSKGLLIAGDVAYTGSFIDLEPSTFTPDQGKAAKPR